jgi:hypothetical protein
MLLSWQVEQTEASAQALRSVTQHLPDHAHHLNQLRQQKQQQQVSWTLSLACCLLQLLHLLPPAAVAALLLQHTAA